MWYYEYLISNVAESYGDEWEPIVDPDNITGEQSVQMNEADKEREEFIKDCISNQIRVWTIQKTCEGFHINTYAEEHAKIVYRLINEINKRLMAVYMLKTTGKHAFGNDKN